MFSFLKEIVESFKEGMEEGREEFVEEEKLAVEERNRYELKKKASVTMERRALAFACPMRWHLINSGQGNLEPHLYKLGELKPAEQDSVRKILLRDFDIDDNADTVDIDNVLIDFSDGFNKDCVADLVFKSSVELYIITACVDVGYIKFSDYQNDIEFFIGDICSCNLKSWEEFGEKFIEGEDKYGSNDFCGKKFLEHGVKHLLTHAESPWVNLSWSDAIRQKQIGFIK